MFETFYESVKSSINSPFNCITATIHYVLIDRGFRCVGMNEELFTTGTIPSTVKSSVLMPNKWGKSNHQISLIYHDKKSKSHFLLKVVNAKDLALVHLMRNTDDNLSKLSIHYKNYIGMAFGQYETAFSNLDGLLELIGEKLVDPLFKVEQMKKKEEEKRSPPSPPNCSHLPPPYSHHPPLPTRPSPYSTIPHPLSPIILPCGRNDLDPLGQCNPPIGGMIFDPLGVFRPPHRNPSIINPSNINPLHIPGGSVPPGARFDPLDPFSSPSGLFGPDPDEMPRPNFDDQFNF